MSDERKNSRLPPPAFPPGTRKVVHRNHSGPPKQPPAPSPDGDEGAFISPDDPLPPRSDAMSRAFISPDDPMPLRRPDALQGALISPEDPMPARGRPGAPGDDGVVMGMGSDAHMDREELVTGGDPHVIELVEAVRKLAEGLKRKGEAGLRTAPSMSRFEATLRAYCVGYLAGRRAEDDAERTEVGTRSQQKLEPPDY